ncbi:MAG: AAA family ATPase, partial [Gemmata sp.]
MAPRHDETTTDTALPTPDRLARAESVRGQLRAARDAGDRLQLDTAKLLCEVREQEYWRDWGHPSFEAYVEADCGFSVRKAQELIKIYRRLAVELGMSDDRIRGLEWSKVSVVARALTPENKDALLGRLADMTFPEVQRLARELTRPSAAPGADAPEAPAAAAPPAGDRRAAVPVDDEFYVRPGDWELLCIAQARGMNVLLKGPTGCGKSELAARAAAAVGRGFQAFNCGAMTEARSALIGNTHYDPARGTVFAPSRFVRAITTPNTTILLDEVSRAPRDAFNLLLTLLDRQGYLALDESESGQVVGRAAGLAFLGTANLGAGYTGADDLDTAFLNRFGVVLDIGFPPPDREAAVLRRRTPGLDADDAERLVSLADRQRRMAQEGEFVAAV